MSHQFSEYDAEVRRVALEEAREAVCWRCQAKFPRDGQFHIYIEYDTGVRRVYECAAAAILSLMEEAKG